MTRIAARDNPEQATFQAHLNPGATDFRVTEGDISAAAVTHANGGSGVFRADAPGVKQLSFTYTLPAKAFPLQLPLEKTGVYEILVEEKTGSGLART